MKLAQLVLFGGLVSKYESFLIYQPISFDQKPFIMSFKAFSSLEVCTETIKTSEYQSSSET